VESRNEDLGKQTIAGVVAHGSRMTTTLPAGREGNDLPLAIVEETWISQELDIVLKSVRDDPRRGRITFEVEQLSYGEPDLSVFVPPAGYKIVDLIPQAVLAATP